VRRFEKPRADMVISGSGPNLSTELLARIIHETAAEVA
jgi:hypothetical protein